ncbi:MAG: hypothetical protein LBB41_05770, partial [Prevotellaceae bacterium]|nr:hypothetical protein [Prevotellaceae bacterium]
MQIGRKDLFWNYAATAMRRLSGIIVLPVTLRLLPPDEVGIWSIFLSLVTITSLLDFGFSSSFSRNVTYIFSGVKELKVSGYAEVETQEVNYSLLKSLLGAMRLYYGVIALAFLLIFAAASPFYFSPILAKYSGAHLPVWVAWFIFGGILAYELYTYYYYAILAGKGKVKISMQIVVLAQSVRILFTITLLLLNFGLLALVIGMLIGDLVNRTLSHRAFFDRETKQKLSTVQANSALETIKIIAPNSIKLGFTALGNFLRSRAIVLIAPYYLTLSELGSYGVTRMLVDLIISMAAAWFVTFYPKIAQYSVQRRENDVKRLYIKSFIASLSL